MFSELKNIGKHTVVYGLGTLLTKVVGFLLIPFYTHYIDPTEYGIMALVDLTGYVISVLVSGQISMAFLKYYYDCHNDEEIKVLVGTSHFIVFSFGLIIIGICLLFTPEICRFIIGNTKYTLLFRLLFINLFFMAFQDVFLAYLRGKEHSRFFITIQVSKTFLCLMLNIYFIAFLKMSILGIFLSTALVTTFFAVSCGVWLIYKTGFKVSIFQLKEILVFGLPMVPTTLFIYTLHYSDRFFLKTYSTMAVVGIYSIGYRFASILPLLVNQPFRLMWNAKLFQLSKHEDGKEIQKKVFTYLIFTLCFFTLAICVPIKEAVYLLTQQKYHEAYKIVPYVVVGYVFIGLSWVFRGGLFINKKTVLDSVVAGITAVANIILNAVLIKKYASIGAAWATMLSYFLFSFLGCIVSHRYYPIQYEFYRVVKIVAAAVLIYATSQLLPDMSIFVTLIVKSFLILTYPLVLYLFDFYEPREKRKLSKAMEAIRL